MPHRYADPVVWKLRLPKCRENDCKLRLAWQDDSRNLLILHEQGKGGGRESIMITEKDVDNANLDVWGEQVQPWLETLHPEASDG